MSKQLIILFLIAVFIISGCSGVTTTEDLQNPLSTLANLAPSQDPKNGMVTGRIITDPPEDRNGLIIYLGEVLIDSNGNVGGFLDKQKAPSGLVNGEDGIFKIFNVPPGQYTLIVYEVVLGGKAYTDDKGNAVIVKVEPGKTIDLGDLILSGY
jgi:hypothetical protein